METAAIVVGSILGHKLTDDNKHALVGLALDDGTELALAATQENVAGLALSLLSALSAFSPETSASGGQLLLPTDWFEIGKVSDGSLVMSFRIPNSGFLRVPIPRTMAERLHEALSTALGTGHTVVPPGASRQ